jgi:hypothetical protein
MTTGQSRIVFVAIATASHLRDARAALQSIATSCPAKRMLYVVGRSRPASATVEDCVEEVDVEGCVAPEVLKQLVTRYTPAEVCFALKPFVLAAALSDADVSSVHYVDSDIRFYARADSLEEAFDGGDILLTPHYLQPFPHDGSKPGVLTLLRGGVFNAGYVGVRNSAESRRFLKWWGESVARYGKNEPALGMCGDQRWLDLVPALFPTCKVWRHPGANVGYWNLHERELVREGDGRYQVNGSELLFFHFSGFDFRLPQSLSKYQTRIGVRGHPALESLLGSYAKQLDESACTPSESQEYVYSKWWHREARAVKLARRWIRKNW